MPRPSRRDHLINTAIDLFCEHGFHATGIDKIIEVAGVSKKTMYQHFRSKEELIMAALQQYDSIFRNNFVREVEKAADTPAARLLAIFDVAHEWFATTNFFGCMFINAVGEYSERESPIRDISKQFKQLMGRYVEQLATEAHANNPSELAQELGLLLEGAIVTAQVNQNPDAAKTAKNVASILVANSLVCKE